jgi:hypothetical protein
MKFHTYYKYSSSEEPNLHAMPIARRCLWQVTGYCQWNFEANDGALPRRSEVDIPYADPPLDLVRSPDLIAAESSAEINASLSTCRIRRF